MATTVLDAVPHRRCRQLVLDGRILIAQKKRDLRSTEELILRYLQQHSPPFDMVQSYISGIVNAGHLKRSAEIAASPQLTGDLRALVDAAIHKANGDFDAALAALDVDSPRFQVRKQIALEKRGIFHRMQDHESIATVVTDFLLREPKPILIPFAVSAAGSAETAHRDDLFAVAIARIIDDIERILRKRKLIKRHWRDAVSGCLTIFDLDGAIRVTRHAAALGFKVDTVLKEILETRADFEPIMHVIDAARQDMYERAGKRKKRPQFGQVIVTVPAASTRTNKLDYPGFRGDIRFALKSIVKTLEEAGVGYIVKSRVRTHGSLNYDKPFFSYHTISDGRLGLHYKETDRRSLFSFDAKGYAGWSLFAETKYDQLSLGQIEQSEADQFFNFDRQRVIGSRVSKYTQVDAQEELPEDFVFVGLQVMGDAVQSLAYTTPFAMLDEVIRACAEKKLKVLVKRHPACRSGEIGHYLLEQEGRGALQVVSGNIHDLIAKSKAVCIINSGVGAEALLHEKPVYVFGRADYMNACFACEKEGDFQRQFEVDRLPMSKAELHRYWYIFRNEYACDLSNPEGAGEWIADRVRQHLTEHAIKGDEACFQSPQLVA
ncbi:hypothetical protein QO002_004508 [Pararhizobium capsulatum DSM 1112]|uniref:Capsule polysaccharide biosynthesis protein n=1 Tax=Pararhizobium capsulatum DSM 1112 TaxID=1121113 RepID=A0ABU0BVL8_9HYPH|nr:hypothetical protein [Pararhizobium capsulatum DSM 1112]